MIAGLNGWKIKISNCFIVNNSGGSTGSLLNTGGTNPETLSLEIYNSTIANNYSYSSVIAMNGANPNTLKNSLVFGNGTSIPRSLVTVTADYNAYDVAPASDE